MTHEPPKQSNFVRATSHSFDVAPKKAEKFTLDGNQLAQIYGPGLALLKKSGFKEGEKTKGRAVPIMPVGVQNGKKGIGHSEKASAPNHKPRGGASDGSGSMSAKKRSELRRRQRREEERRLGLARGTLTPANDKPKTCNTWKKGRGGKSTKKESERRRLRRRKFEEILGLPRGALGTIDILANAKWSIFGVTRTFGIQDALVERKLQEFQRGVEHGRRANMKRDAQFENPPTKRRHVNPPHSQHWGNNSSNGWNNHNGTQNWNNSGGHPNRNNYQNGRGYRNSGSSTFSGPMANRGGRGRNIRHSRGRGRPHSFSRQNHDRQNPYVSTYRQNVRNNHHGISRGRGRQDFHRNSRGRGTAYHQQQNYGVNRGCPPNEFNNGAWSAY